EADLIPLGRRRLARLVGNLVVAVLWPPGWVVRLGIRDRLVIGRTESLFCPIEEEAIAFGKGCLLQYAAIRRLGDDVDRESPIAREYRGDIVGHHETILRMRQPTELHPLGDRLACRPGGAAVAGLRKARKQRTGTSAVRDRVIVVGNAHVGRT